MTENVTDTELEAGDGTVPTQRGPAREVAIRELRNAGRVLAELERAGAVGKVTSGGRLVGWLVPASDDEQLIEQFVDEGRLIPAERPGGLAGRQLLPRRSDRPSLSETLIQMRAEERC